MSDALSNATTLTASVALALFLVTYLSHSTIMLGAAWLISREPILLSHSVKDILYKTALIGSLVTTLIQFALFVQRGAARRRILVPGASHV